MIDLDSLLFGGVERGLSMASYTIVESIKSGLPIGIRIGRMLIPPASNYAHKKDLLKRLALYEERKAHEHSF